MSKTGNRERLSRRMLGNEAKAAGFQSGTKESGYYMPERDLITYYRGRVDLVTGDHSAIVRGVLVMTDGSDWYVGARNGDVDTNLLLKSMYESMKDGRKSAHAVEAEKLAEVLRDTVSLPEIELIKPRGSAYKQDTQSHSFE